MIITVPHGDSDSQSVTHRVENHLWVYFGVIFSRLGYRVGVMGAERAAYLASRNTADC